MGLQVVTPPVLLPVALEVARAHLRIVDDLSQDDLITAYLHAAAAEIGNRQERQLMSATLRMACGNWPTADCTGHRWLKLRGPNCELVEINYYDANNDAQTLDTTDVLIDTSRRTPRLYFASTLSLPEVYFRPDAIQIDFTAGYEAADDLEPTTRQAILLRLGDYFSHRETMSVGAAPGELPGYLFALADVDSAWNYP